MEILIIGGALVALMVYVSTRIKKSAARAYEREIVETEEFRLIKTEGFIIPVGENSEYVFEARSKDYGDDETHDFLRAAIELSVFSNSDFETICRDGRQSFDKIISEEVSNSASAEQNICLLEGEKTDKEIPFYILRKIIESDDRRIIYDLKIAVLRDYREQYEDKAKETIKSFQAN